MTHRSADRLSDAIDRWLASQGSGSGHLSDVLEALDDALPEVSDSSARERVRRRLAGVSPMPRSPQQLLLERVFDELERVQRRVREEDYVPWTALAGAAVVIVGAIAIAAWLRRKGLDTPVVET